MKILLTILTVIFALAALAVLALFLWMFAGSFGGGFNVVLPGPGLIVDGTLVLISLFVLEAILLFITILLARKISRPVE